VAWIGITTITALHWPTALAGKYHRDEGFLTFLNYAVLYFLTLQLADRSSRIRTLALGLFGSGLMVAGYGAFQYFGLDPIPWNIDFAQRAFSTYGNPNILGGFLTFSIPIALGLALAEKDTRLRMLFWGGFFLNVFVLVASFTRAAWIGGAVALVFTAIIAFRHGARVTRLDAFPQRRLPCSPPSWWRSRAASSPIVSCRSPRSVRLESSRRIPEGSRQGS
jgi:hypothetical protein